MIKIADSFFLILDEMSASFMAQFSTSDVTQNPLTIEGQWRQQQA